MATDLLFQFQGDTGVCRPHKYSQLYDFYTDELIMGEWLILEGEMRKCKNATFLHIIIIKLMFFFHINVADIGCIEAFKPTAASHVSLRTTEDWHSVSMKLF